MFLIVFSKIGFDIAEKEPCEVYLFSMYRPCRYTCGLRTDKSVQCWGDDKYGQASPPEGQFRSVQVGFDFSCGIAEDRKAICWGSNTRGQLDVPPGTYADLSVGWQTACGVLLNGTTVCWGFAEDDQADLPEGRFNEVSTGGSHVCAIRTEDRQLACWGTVDDYPTDSFLHVCSGFDFTCGVLSSHRVRCFGADGHLNLDGQLDAPSGFFLACSAGGKHACAIRVADESIVCWGSNLKGQTAPPRDTDDSPARPLPAATAAPAASAAERGAMHRRRALQPSAAPDPPSPSPAPSHEPAPRGVNLRLTSAFVAVSTAAAAIAWRVRGGKPADRAQAAKRRSAPPAPKAPANADELFPAEPADVRAPEAKRTEEKTRAELDTWKEAASPSGIGGFWTGLAAERTTAEQDREAARQKAEEEMRARVERAKTDIKERAKDLRERQWHDKKAAEQAERERKERRRMSKEKAVAKDNADADSGLRCPLGNRPHVSAARSCAHLEAVLRIGQRERHECLHARLQVLPVPRE